MNISTTFFPRQEKDNNASYLESLQLQIEEEKRRKKEEKDKRMAEEREEQRKFEEDRLKMEAEFAADIKKEKAKEVGFS